MPPAATPHPNSESPQSPLVARNDIRPMGLGMIALATTRNLVDVTGPGHRCSRGDCRDQAARGHIARLVAVVAVLAGLLWLHSLPCADGMTADDAMTHGPNTLGHSDVGAAFGPAIDMTMNITGCAHPATASAPMPAMATTIGTAIATVTHTAWAGLVGQHSPDPDGTGGALATCLLFIVAALGTLVGLLRAGTLLVATVQLTRARPGAAARAALMHPPRLSELCVLRI
jgi:hypothetical protein